MNARTRIALIISLLLVLSAAGRLYLLSEWGEIPTSDPYFFVAWASGITRTSHLEFPGSEDNAYGDYPDGYPMLLVLLSSTTGASLLDLSTFLPVLLGALCLLPIYLVFRGFVRDRLYCIGGTCVVIFSFTFLKYTSVSIPNLIGLYFFGLSLFICLGSRWKSKRTLVLALAIPALAKLHYLSLVCVGVAIGIVLSRRIMLRASGAEFDPRRIAFLLIVILIGGVVAWTAAYRLMRQIYGIDITAQPPPRLSQATKLYAYPLIFGLVQTLALPVGLLASAWTYYGVNFRARRRRTITDPVLLVSIWFAFFAFAAGFFKVEYYPFRFNSFLMLPFGMISTIGLLHVAGFLSGRGLERWERLLVPVVIVATFAQPLVLSRIPMGEGSVLLPWRQEYDEGEKLAMEWSQDSLLPVVDGQSIRPLSKYPVSRDQMLMADWVRSRAFRAKGFDNVHLHWWFFQGVDDRTGQPYLFRSMDIYTGNITHALLLLGRLNVRSSPGLFGDHAYYYKYIYASDAIAELIEREFKRKADLEKFDQYDGSCAYFASLDDAQDDKVMAREYVPEGYQKAGGSRRDLIYNLYPIQFGMADMAALRLKPFDRIYSAGGVRIYYRAPIRT